MNLVLSLKFKIAWQAKFSEVYIVLPAFYFYPLQLYIIFAYFIILTSDAKLTANFSVSNAFSNPIKPSFHIRLHSVGFATRTINFHFLIQEYNIQSTKNLPYTGRFFVNKTDHQLCVVIIVFFAYNNSTERGIE